MSVELEVVEDPARACAAMMVGAAAGGGHVVLTGGSTPRTAYEEFVGAVQAVDVDVSQTHFWFGDERCVPPEDDRSNFRLARESIFEPLGDRGGTVHRMSGESGPADGAAAYAAEIEAAGDPEFDLLLLGLGPDGHCASLFPGQDAVGVRDRSVVGVPQAGLEPFVPRISLTLTTIGRARRVVFLVSGESKADAVSRAFAPAARPSTEVPSSLVPTVAEQVSVLLDPAAASGLS
jgi:6-phosphogluconolactonase